MKYFRTKQERHSARLTALIALLLILLLFVVGPPYMDPPEEYGVTVNFGTTDFGSGTRQTQTPTPTNNEDIPEPNETKTAVASESIANSTEEVLTSDEEAAIAVKKVDQEALKKQVEEEAKAKADAERIRKENEAKERKKKALDDLMGGLEPTTETPLDQKAMTILLVIKVSSTGTLTRRAILVVLVVVLEVLVMGLMGAVLQQKISLFPIAMKKVA